MIWLMVISELIALDLLVCGLLIMLVLWLDVWLLLLWRLMSCWSVCFVGWFVLCSCIIATFLVVGFGGFWVVWLFVSGYWFWILCWFLVVYVNSVG